MATKLTRIMKRKVFILKTYMFLFNQMALFEVVLASYFLKEKGEVIYVSEDNQSVVTEEGFLLNSHISVEQIPADEADILIIPGGNHAYIRNPELLSSLVLALHAQNKIIAGICNGSRFISRLLNIENPTKTVIMHNHIVLSPGNESVDFAIELGRLVNVFQDEADLQETISFFKHFKGVPNGES